VQWYEAVKRTQGSVETTSFGQLDNILDYGVYKISVTKSTKTVDDLVAVKLETKEKVLKTMYTLNELRDLESKLVLICGSKADARAKVDFYINVSVYTLICAPLVHNNIDWEWQTTIL